MRKLFLLEDDLSLISGLTFAFKKQGFALDTARTLAEAEVLWSDRKYDLLVLDVSLPDGSGFDFCQKVRRTSNVPILFLTASDEEMNIIMGLELGGDDYLTKPFKLGVLLSRVNALLRRANASSAGEPVLESGSITVRLLQGQAYKNGILLELTGAEYKLLCFFMQHPNAVLSKEQILDALWDCDGDYIDSSALTVYIRRLRMKIEDDPGKPGDPKFVPSRAGGLGGGIGSHAGHRMVCNARILSRVTIGFSASGRLSLGRAFSLFPKAERASGTGSPANPKLSGWQPGCTTGLRPGGRILPSVSLR